MKKNINLERKGDLALFLVQLRRRESLTQQEMADILYISRPTYASWESNWERVPLCKFISIVELFNVTDSEVLEVVLGKKLLNTSHKGYSAEIVIHQLRELTDRLNTLIGKSAS